MVILFECVTFASKIPTRNRNEHSTALCVLQSDEQSFHYHRMTAALQPKPSFNPWRDMRTLPREMWILSAATLVNRMGMMALPFLTLYLTEHLHYSQAHAGYVLSLYGVGALITAPFAGRLSDHVGPLRIMRMSLLLSGVLLFFVPLVQSYAALCGLAFIWAMVSEAFRPASMSIISDWVLPEQRKAAFALNRLAINLGMSIGPAAGGFIAAASFTALFVIDGATSIIAGLMLLFATMRAQVPHVAEAHAQRGMISTQSIFTDWRFLYFLAAMLPVVIVFFQHNSTLPLFIVRDLHLSESAYGLLFALNTVMIILIEVPLNTSMAHWSHRSTLALGSLLWGIGFGVLIFAHSWSGAAVSIAIWTFGEMMLFPSSANYVSEIAPSERRGVYMGVYQMTFSLAFILAPWLGTQMLERFGATWLWSATLVLGILSAVMMWRIGETMVAKRAENS